MLRLCLDFNTDEKKSPFRISNELFSDPDFLKKSPRYCQN